MESKSITSISVRGLVEFVMRSGDLGGGFASNTRMMEGIKAHHIISSSSNEEYVAEVPVSYIVEKDGIYLEVNGRIDGIIKVDDCVIIDEIKSTTCELDDINEDYNMMHWAQVKCYAYMYGRQNEINTLKAQLTYYQISQDTMKCFRKEFTINELESFFYSIVDKYIYWIEKLKEWTEKRNLSIQQMKFPFEKYRMGQRELAISVYKTIRNNGKLFVQAPTGTGKTIATLFPTIKAMGEGFTSKIFYLTAKTVTATIAESAFGIMRNKGLRIKTINITAKEKICFNPETACDPEQCRFKTGYYDRLNTAIEDIFQHDSFTRQVIEEYAMKYQLCPFEFSLDLSIWCDCVVCDYNYVFDPTVYLKRYFMMGGSDYTFLIDEAHNLVDRAREMFSAELLKKPLLDLKRWSKSIAPVLYKSLNEINRFMIKARKCCEEEDKKFHVQNEVPKEFCTALKKFTGICDRWLSKNDPGISGQKLLDFYFQALNFLKISEFYDQRYVTYYEKAGSDIKIKMLCLDPSYLLQQAMKRGKSTVLFSATLTPMDYFIQILGGCEESSRMRLASPFCSENLCLLVNDAIATTYRMRELTYCEIAKCISEMVTTRAGNYLAFFPSYQYMNEVYIRFCEMNSKIRTICQWPGMLEEDREHFIDQFSVQTDETLAGFAVMGGIFGEGIDLVGERLSGAVIVGVGLPQICLEREIIRNYFEEEKGMGFEYAYVYPGMNKVMQAAGRVIRTEEDRGVVLLIDQRFSYPSYKKLFPQEWNSCRYVKNSKLMIALLKNFWK